MGYLPAALVNYLGRLGWSLDDKTEVMSLDTMIANFGLERVNDSPASFDPEKLAWMAGEYMKLLPLADRVAGVLPFLVRAKLIAESLDAATRDRVTAIVAACAERIKIFSDILQYPYFFRDPVLDPALVEKRIKKAGMPETLRDFAAEIKALQTWDVANLETKTKAFCEARGLKLGDLNHAIRVATTGVMVGPGVFDLLAILGRDEVLRRIDGIPPPPPPPPPPIITGSLASSQTAAAERLGGSVKVPSDSEPVVAHPAARQSPRGQPRNGT